MCASVFVLLWITESLHKFLKIIFNASDEDLAITKGRFSNLDIPIFSCLSPFCALCSYYNLEITRAKYLFVIKFL